MASFSSNLRSQKEFFLHHDVTSDEYDKSTYRWRDLQKIYSDFLTWQVELQAEGDKHLPILRQNSAIRAVYARPKDPEHLIRKLIKRSAKTGTKYATFDNYIKTVTDLVGIRVLHYVKEDWHGIHAFIMQHFPVHGKPQAKVAWDDPPGVKRMYEAACEIEETKGYRSVHYCIPINCRRIDMFAELQVRTLFEEAWGEISHKIDYPKPTDLPLLTLYIEQLSFYAGTSDTIASAALYLNDFNKIKNKRGTVAAREKEHLWAMFAEKADYLAKKGVITGILAGQIPAEIARKLI